MINFSTQIFNLVPPKLKIVLLCSSGIDSISTSHFFIKKFKYSKNISLLHFNHNLREQNLKMKDSFKAFAENLSISYEIKDLKCKDSTENSCRQARIEHLKNYKDTVFITAHHLDDCTESYLLNCIRGKEGFLPIPFFTELESNFLSRPFLFNRKKDLIEYAHRNNLLQFVVEDETNSQVKGSRRNLLRNKILPLLNEEKVGLQTIVKKKMLSRLINQCS